MFESQSNNSDFKFNIGNLKAASVLMVSIALLAFGGNGSSNPIRLLQKIVQLLFITKRFPYTLITLLFFTVEVSANTPPTINSTAITSATQDAPYSYALSGSDPDADTLTWSFASGAPNPDWLSIVTGSPTIQEIGIVSGPGGIAQDVAGNIYVAELSGDQIYRITPVGVKSSYATVDPSSKYGLLVHGQYLYISYYNLNKITRIDMTNPGAGESDWISSITDPLAMIARDGYMYVAQYAADKVSKIEVADPLNMTDFIVGTPYPFGIGITKDFDKMYIANHNSKFLSSATITAGALDTLTPNIKTFASPLTDVKLDSQGNIYVSSFGGGIKKLSADLSTETDIGVTTSRVWGMNLDTSGTLSWGLNAQNRVLKLETGSVLTGTPTNADVGENSVSVSVTDSIASGVTQSFKITVANINDAPTFRCDVILPSVLYSSVDPVGQDIDSLLATQFSDIDPVEANGGNGGYTFAGIAVSANTADISNEGIWQYSFDGSTWIGMPAVTSTNALLLSKTAEVRFLPVNSFIGTPGTLTVHPLDDSISTTFSDIGLAQTINITSKNSTTGEVGHTGKNLSITVASLLLTAPTDVNIDASGLFTFAAIGSATAADASDSALNVRVTQIVSNGCSAKILTSNPTHFTPGVHVLSWTATDAESNSTTAMQTVNVTPMVGFSKNQTAREGDTVTFKVILNGSSVTYPVTVPYTVAGTAATDGSDHNLVSGSVDITASNLQASVAINLVDDGVGEGAETLTLTMGTPTNAVKGSAVEHQLEISEINVAPHGSLTAVQSSGVTRLIGQFDGSVTVTTAVVDSVGDTHTYDWSLTDNSLTDIDGAEGSFTFNPAGLVPGFYKMHVKVSDGTDAQLVKLLLKVIATLPVLTGIDTDQDGINDDVEGAGDSDSDGIPNYLDDEGLAGNTLQQQSMVSQTFIMEAESGLMLKLGQTAFRANVNSASVNSSEIVIHGNHGAGASADTSVDYGAGLFDFIIEGIPVAGQSAQVVLTQFAAITADAAYRKLMPSGWLDFVEDENNALASAPGDKGFCPPPGDATYTTGLNEGHWCVQLTIQDGGPNDADGVANNTIEDPSGSTSLKPIVGGGGGTVPVEILILLSLILGRRLRHQRPMGKFLMLGSAILRRN